MCMMVEEQYGSTVHSSCTELPHSVRQYGCSFTQYGRVHSGELYSAVQIQSYRAQYVVYSRRRRLGEIQNLFGKRG